MSESKEALLRVRHNCLPVIVELLSPLLAPMLTGNRMASQTERGAIPMASTSDKSYTYDQLEGEGAIRVLILQPATSPTEELRATLVHHQLKDLPSYKAISYIWGCTRVERAFAPR